MVHKLGILISGRGSNMDAIIKACTSGKIPAVVACVISNNKSALGIKKAEESHIKTFVIDKSKSEFESEASKVLKSFQVDLVCLAGFMRILSSSFISEFPDRILNIHPSLLPLFKGMKPQKQALEAGAKFSGCTVHYVTPDVDAGKIVKQSIVKVLDSDTEESLSDRIISVEHKCYVKAIKKVLAGIKPKLLTEENPNLASCKL